MFHNSDLDKSLFLSNEEMYLTPISHDLSILMGSSCAHCLCVSKCYTLKVPEEGCFRTIYMNTHNYVGGSGYF